MSAERSASTLRLLTGLLWGFFGVGHIVLWALDRLPGTLFDALAVGWWLILWLVWIALLIRHGRFWGQWRGVFLAWALCTLALTIASGGVTETAATGAMLVVLYTIVAGWFALLALTVRRDVSVAYLALFFFIAPLLFRSQILLSGSVLGLFTPNDAGPVASPFDATVMMLTCLPPLGLFGFIAHFLVLGWREWQRRPLALPPSSSSVATETP
jgi:hypothetical protein